MTEDFYNEHIVPYRAILWRLCRAYTNGHEDFEDCFQEVCLQIWLTRDRFEGNSTWSTWIYRITLNVCLTRLKKEKTRQTNEENIEQEQPVELDKNKAEQSLEVQSLYSAIQQLNNTDRAIILLYLEEFSYKEISKIIGRNPSAIGARINRIKSRLQDILNIKEKQNDA